MSIVDLLRVLPPPKTAREVPSPTSWADVEKQVGRLPADDKRFVERYGTGKIDDFIVVCNPFSTNEFVNLASFSSLARRGLEAEITSGSWERAGRLDASRLMPFGMTDNGDRLVWLTDGEPDDWGVLVLDSRRPELDLFAGGITAFLVATLEGELRSNVFPEDVPSDAPEFTPS